MTINQNIENIIKEITKIVKYTFAEIKILYAAMINMIISGKIILYSSKENNTKQTKFILFLVEQLHYYSHDQLMNSLFNLYERNNGNPSFFGQLKNKLEQISLNINKEYFERTYYPMAEYSYVDGMRARKIPKGFKPFLHPLNVARIRNKETAHRDITYEHLKSLKLQIEESKRIFTSLDAYYIFDKTWQNFQCILRKIQQRKTIKKNFNEFINWKHKPITKLDKFTDQYASAYIKFLKRKK
ncbi:MAG: hypothetical protein IJP83_01070 [Mycoplasma sp.]|nr:hypothetical protein [Mycoplasma sp.]